MDSKEMWVSSNKIENKLNFLITIKLDMSRKELTIPLHLKNELIPVEKDYH